MESKIQKDTDKDNISLVKKTCLIMVGQIQKQRY